MKKETKTIDISKEEYSNTVGSCAQPVSAIYGTLDNDKLSNIYENGHIILRQQQQRNSKWKRICSESKPVLAVIFVSLVVFITAGAILLYQSRKSLFFDDSQVDFQTQEWRSCWKCIKSGTLPASHLLFSRFRNDDASSSILFNFKYFCSQWNYCCGSKTICRVAKTINSAKYRCVTYFWLLLGTQYKVCRFFATLGLLMSALTCEFPWKTISTHHRKCLIQLSYSLRRFMFCIFCYFWRGWIYKKSYNWLGTNYKYIFKSNYILKVKISTYLYLFKIHFGPMSTTY